jgi:hypothetical protein
VTTKPGGKPFAETTNMAACLPAGNDEELDQIGRGYLENLVRLIVSLITSSERVKYLIFDAVIRNPRFTTIIVERARTGLAEDLAAPRTVEVDARNIRFEPVYGAYRASVGSSRIAVIIGAIVGLLAGVWAMMMIDATPVTVNVASQTASVGIAQAVDKPWFIAICIVITTLVGAALGGFKQRYETVNYVSSVRPVYDSSKELEESEGR